MAEGLAFALFGKVSNAAVKREAKRRQLIKDRPLCHRRSAPTGQRRLSGERRRNLSASEDIERIANSRVLSTSSSLDMGTSSGRLDLLSKRSGSTPSADSSDDDEEEAHHGFIVLQSTPVETVETTTLRLEPSSGPTDCNGVLSAFQSHLPASRTTVTVTYMIPDENDARSLKTVRVFVYRNSSNDVPNPPLEKEEFAPNATAEDLALFCAAEARIPSKFFPLFALYSPNPGVFLPPSYPVATLARDTDFVELEFRIRLALRPPQRSTFYSYTNASEESEVLREYIYHQLKEDFIDGRIMGSLDAEDEDRRTRGTTLCEVLGSKSRNSRKTITRTKSAGTVEAGSSLDYRFLCLQPATFSLYLEKPANTSINEYLRRMTSRDINKHLPPNRSLIAQCKMIFLGRNCLKDLIKKGFKRIEENGVPDRGVIQLNYIKRVMSICNPFEERFAHYPPSSFSNSSFDRDDGDDEPEEEIIVRLKPNDAFPVIVLSKDKDLVEIPVTDIHRVEVLESKVDLILNPRTITLSLENPLQAESFVALINSYAMLSPRLDKPFSLCSRGTLGSSRYFSSLNAVKCLVAAARKEMRHLFESAGNEEDGFLVIEDKEKVAHLHIHMLRRIDDKSNEARIEEVASLVYDSRTGQWRTESGPSQLFDPQLRTILNTVVKEQGKYCRNIGPLRNCLSIAVLYPSAPLTDNARASPKMFTDMEISGGEPISDRPGFSRKSIKLEGRLKSVVIRQSGKYQIKIDEHVNRRIQSISEWSQADHCPVTLLRSFGSCLDPLSLVLEKDAENIPLDQWMSHMTSEAGDTDFLARTAVSLCDQVSRALQFLATRDIPHGNVAASNVIVIPVAKTDVKVKLGDPVFTFSKWEDRIARTAPDLWEDKSLKKLTLIAADVWAFGTFMWEVFSFDSLSLQKIIPGTSNATKQETEDFLRNNCLPQPKPISDKFQDQWDRAYKVMEQCWTRDINSRPRISVVNDAIWKYLLSPEPEDMKSFEEFFVSYQELPGAPIKSGDFCDGTVDDGKIIIPDELSENSYSFESPDGIKTFKRLRQIGEKSLGEGFFGEVYRGEIVFNDEVYHCAVKRFSENMEEEDIRREACIGLRVPKHENLVELIGYYHYEANPPKYLLIMELLDESLEKYLKRSKGVETNGWEWDQQRRILIQIAKGMEHLHCHDVLHRDLATRNVLLKSRNANFITAKVGDFGLSRITENYYARQNSKTPNYMYPPETLESPSSKFYPEGDVWSFGLLALEVCSPQPSINMSQEFKNIGGKQGVIGRKIFPPLGCPSPIYEGLVLRCLKYEKEDRPLFRNGNSRTTIEKVINAVTTS